MNKYTNYCTESQAKKAFELGAPIGLLPDYMIGNHFPVKCKDGKERYVVLPTIEQMISWLEKHNLFINVFWEDCMYEAEIKNLDNEYLGISNNFPTRKDAALKAIDVALEYLSNNKE